MGIECLLTNSSLTSVHVEPGSMSAFFKRYGPKYPPIAPVSVAICARVCWRPKASRRASMACPYTSRLLLPASIPIGIVQLSRTYFCHCASRTGFRLACLGCAALSTVGHTGAEGCAGAAPSSLLLRASRASALSCRSPRPLAMKACTSTS